MSPSLTGMADWQAQEAIRARCFHPSGLFAEFKKGEIEQSIPDRFERMVAAYPDRVAVNGKNDRLTYRELTRTANRIARCLLAHQKTEEQPIALLFEPGTLMVAGILGALKAGKAWVPLLTSYPRQRAICILEDTQATLIVTNVRNISAAQELTEGQRSLMVIDDLDDGVSDEDLDLTISPDTVACILYTSGSTGQPKGVVQNHRNILHLIMRSTNSLHICCEDRLTLLSTYTHVAGLTDIFRALLNGATLYPFDLKEEGLVNLTDWLIREEITLYHSIPSVFRHAMEALEDHRVFTRMRAIHLGGERVTKREVQLYKRHFPESCILLHNLGATEISGYQQYLIDKDTTIPGNVVPAGYSAEDTEILLLNESGETIESDAIGEIAVKSRYLALGYWRNPDLTRTAFLPDPQGDKRIYRTGDLGRMLPDGKLVHLGRRDYQLKVRGYRIEAGEIETALLDLDEIKSVVVVAAQDEAADGRLVAYVVAANHPAPTATVLSRYLRKKIPDYMIPSAFVFLDALPLTPNGKIDRQALPPLDVNRLRQEEIYVAPRSSAEKLLAEIWTEILKVDQVGIRDKFLDLGGNSLLGIRMMARVQEAFHTILPLRTLFERPTVEDLALAITQQSAETEFDHMDLIGILRELETISDEEAQNLMNPEMSIKRTPK